MLPSSHILKGLYAKHRFEWLQPTRLRALCSKDGIWEYYCKLKQAGNSIKTLLSKRTFRGSRNQVGSRGGTNFFGSFRRRLLLWKWLLQWCSCNEKWLLSHTSGIPQGTSDILWLFVLFAPQENNRKHLKRGVEMVQQFSTPDFGARRQGLLAPKAVVVVDTTPHKAVTCGELELSCAIVEDATKKWRYMALPFEPLSAREPAGPASRSLRALWSRAQVAVQLGTGANKGDLLMGMGDKMVEQVVRKSWDVVSKQVVCHWFVIWFVTLWVLHLMLTEGGVGTHADVGESDSRDVERRCLKHKETQTGASYHIIPWPLMRGGGLDSRQDIFSAVCGHGILSSSNSSTSSTSPTITPCCW